VLASQVADCTLLLLLVLLPVLLTCSALRGVSVVNLALACLLLPAAASTACVVARRCLLSLAASKRWTQRRRRLFGLYATQVS